MNRLTISRRTNNEWIKQLSDPVDEEALLDLRNLLQNGLRPALKDMITEDPDQKIEELTQQALNKILGKIPTFNGEGNFTTWALKVAIHLAFSYLRFERLVENSLGKFFIPAKRMFSIPCSQNNPVDDSVVEQIQSYILAVISSSIENDFTESQRAALFAIYQQGLSNKDCSRQLGVSPNELEKLLVGVRALIRRLIKEKFDLSVPDVITIFNWPHQDPEEVQSALQKNDERTTNSI